MKKTNNTHKRQSISLLLLTHNSSKDLDNNFSWLDSCPTINEIVAVDDISNDDTIVKLKHLASKKRKVVILERPLGNDFASQHRFGLAKTSNDWVIWLDSDEQPSNKLVSFLKKFNGDGHNYSFKRQEFFLKQKLKYGETAQLNFLRLFNKHYGDFIGQVHEEWQSPQPTIYTDYQIIHNSNRTLATFLRKINRYSDIRSQELYSRGIKTNLFQICFYPLAKFIMNYFFRLGFLDSTPGIIFALSVSFYTFLVRAKLWHLWQK